MAFTILDYAEIGTAVGTILLSIVTVFITLYQIRRQRRNKIQEWRDLRLSSHYIQVEKSIEEFRNLIGKDDVPKNSFDGHKIFFPTLSNVMNSVFISDDPLIRNYVSVVESPIEKELGVWKVKNKDTLDHMSSGYPDIELKINKVNKDVEIYRKNLSNNFQKFVSTFYIKIYDEFGLDWHLSFLNLEHYDSKDLFHTRVITPESNSKSMEIWSKELIDSYVECAIKDAVYLEATKDKDRDISTISIKYKTKASNEFIELENTVAKAVNYPITDEDLSKFAKIWTEMKQEMEEVKRLFEEKGQINRDLKHLEKLIAENILDQYSAGLRIKGECNVCKLIRDAGDDEIRPYPDETAQIRSEENE